MPDAELPPSESRLIQPVPDGSATELDLALPASLRGWVSALALWPVIDESRHRLATRCLGEASGGWTAFVSTALEAGLIQARAEPDTYVFRPEWAQAIGVGLEQLGGADALRATLLDCWLADPDREVVPGIANWARDRERWDVLDELWFALTDKTADLPSAALAVFRDLPAAARKARPTLTWASGAAASFLSPSGPRGTEAALQRLLLDSAMLHADWSVREDTDEAVSAGSYRMLGERRLPASRLGQSLEAAWRTKQEVDAFIDARSREGRGPSRRALALFRTFSARLALWRGDAMGAISEARWARILTDWEPVLVLAAGVQALATSISTDDGPAFHSDPPVAGIEDELGVRGLRGMGLAYEILADGNEALRRLDRAGVERALSLVAPEAAAMPGIWAVRVGLEAFRDAFWGDVAAGLNRISLQVSRLSIFGHEQDEPLGASILGRARTLLLTKSGAFVAAAQSLEGLPEDLRLLPQARIELWAGQIRRAIQLADSASYLQGSGGTDLYRLRLVKAAASLLDGGCDAAVAAEVIQQVRHLLETENFIPIGVLPQPAREAVIELCRPELGAEPRFAQLLERIAELNDVGGRGVRPIHLTEREGILLPMLDSDDSVPDIARKLQVSVNTVRKQVVTLREKFGADTRGELVRKARTYGAIP